MCFKQILVLLNMQVLMVTHSTYMRFHNARSIFVILTVTLLWLGSLIRALDLWLDGHKFDSQPLWQILDGWQYSGGQPQYFTKPPRLNSASYPQWDVKWVPAKVHGDALQLGSKGRYWYDRSFHLRYTVHVGGR